MDEIRADIGTGRRILRKEVSLSDFTLERILSGCSVESRLVQRTGRR